MKIAGLDFEATGVDPLEARIIEIGAVIWDSKDWSVQEEFSMFVHGQDYPVLTDVVTDVTGITLDMLTGATDPNTALEKLVKFIERAEYVVAHNIKYDATLLQAELDRHRMGASIPVDKWICSYLHVPYPKKYRCKQLSHLLLDHGEMVDGSTSHRALDDVKMIGRLLKCGEYYLDDILKYRDEPWVYLSAIIPPPWEDNGRGKEQAKKHGYSYQQVGYDGPEFPKTWVKRVKESQLDEEKAVTVPFKRAIVFRDNPE